MAHYHENTMLGSAEKPALAITPPASAEDQAFVKDWLDLAHAKALRGSLVQARDAARIAERVATAKGMFRWANDIAHWRYSLIG